MKIRIALLLSLLTCAATLFGAEPTLNLALQTWSLNRLTLEEIMDKAADMGVKYLEVHPRLKIWKNETASFTHNMDMGTRERVLQMAKDKGVRIVSHGVVGVKVAKDATIDVPAEWKKIFEFAKAMRLEWLTCEPPDAQIPVIAELSRAYQIPVAFHNHPGTKRFGNPQTALPIVAELGDNVTLCPDTGHYQRANYDPVAGIEHVKGKVVYAIHAKDLNEMNNRKNAHDVPWGTGVGNMAGQLAALKKAGFKGYVILEYEYRGPDAEAQIRDSVAFFNRANATPVADLESGKIAPAAK